MTRTCMECHNYRLAILSCNYMKITGKFLNILYDFSIVQVFLLLEPQLIQGRIYFVKENHKASFDSNTCGAYF